MIDRLAGDHGLARIDASLLLSVAGGPRTGEIVDQPNWIGTACCLRSIFGWRGPARGRRLVRFAFGQGIPAGSR
jgi:acetamidase/formamidase